MKTYFCTKGELGGYSIRRRLTRDQQEQSGKKYIHLYFVETLDEAHEYIGLLEAKINEVQKQQSQGATE